MAKETQKGKPVKKKTKGIWQLYEVKGNKVERKAPWSPKLGPGYFLAVHENRNTCGQTGYTEFKKKEVKKEK